MLGCINPIVPLTVVNERLLIHDESNFQTQYDVSNNCKSDGLLSNAGNDEYVVSFGIHVNEELPPEESELLPI